jgi:hypothetical protein
MSRSLAPDYASLHPGYGPQISGCAAAFAVVLAAISVLVPSGLDRRVETLLVHQSPQWLTDLTTRF